MLDLYCQADSQSRVTNDFQMLLRAKDVDVKGSNDLVDSTKAILFLGTPHMGSHLANTGDVLRAIVAATGFDTANQNLEVLKAGGMMLEQIRERFYGLHRRQGFEVYTFEEELGMTGIGFAKFGNKVDRTSFHRRKNRLADTHLGGST